jgi:uracil-DNA glycosylase family 4
MSLDPARRAAFLEEMGLGPVWTSRARAGAAMPATDVPVQLAEEGTGVTPAVSGADIATMDWDALETAVAGCTRCGLCKSRTRTVFGVGDRAGSWLFVGEGPGRQEDLQGEPFVGPAGKLLDNMLAALGVARGKDAYIANVVKCRPADESGRDRPPTADEMTACMPYLRRQIELLQPQSVVALGKTAAVALLQADPETAVARMRGKLHRYGSLPLVVTYHPAYLLRTLADKGKAWLDLCLALRSRSAPSD